MRARGAPGTALRGADIALQEAKTRGGNRMAVLDADMLARRMRQLAIVDLLRAERLDGFHVVYQPIVLLSEPDRPLVAVEALARWEDPELGRIGPDEFIPLAERSGTIGAVGLRVLADALRNLARWHASGLPLHVSVNVSWAQVHDADGVDRMMRLLMEHRPMLPWLILEATEGGFADDSIGVDAFARLRDLGVTVAIDDFGIGSSSLTRLRTLPVDLLKLDRSLLRGVGDESDAEAVLAAIVRLGADLGITTIVEGVEDERTARAVADLGLVHSQGFLHGRPGPAAAISGRRVAAARTLHRRSRAAASAGRDLGSTLDAV